MEQLINEEDDTWKEDVIRDIFIPPDTDEILKIRLPSYDQEDFVAWTCEKNGIFLSGVRQPCNGVKKTSQYPTQVQMGMVTGSCGKLSGVQLHHQR